MKQIIRIIILLCLYAETMLGVPVKKVMLTLAPDEIINWGEYLSNCRISSYNFICILWNKTTKKETLVWNGQRKQSGDWIRLHHIDTHL